jgi:PKD repeat protein
MLVAACALLALLSVATSSHAQDSFEVSDPELFDCGNVSVNGVVITTPPTLGLVWDWGDGSKTTSWFPATHRYATNGNFTVTVTAAGCNTLVRTTTANITNVENPPSCPPAGTQSHYYLVPYDMHLTAGTTSADPLQVVDQDGNPVPGTITFTMSDPQDLVSLSDGYVTAEREEDPDGEAGVWVRATLNNQQIVSNTCVVRVLPEGIAIPDYVEAPGERTRLYYPTFVNGQNIAALVDQFDIPVANEYAYQIQSRLMGTTPFNGSRQLFEVDLGISESNRVCGISGNPIRLGWNTGEVPWDPWRNCFLVPFPVWNPPPPLSPQWGVFYHELGHNMTSDSFTFTTALGHYWYIEGLASAMGLAAIKEIIGYPEKYPIGNYAFLSMQWIYDRDASGFTTAMQQWLFAPGGAAFSAITPDIVDGIWLTHGEGVSHFADRFFLPLHPLMIEELGEVLCQVQTQGPNGQHTFFAALMSAAAGIDLCDTFRNDYNYPLDEGLYGSAYAAFTGIIAQRECPGDFDKDGSSDEADLVLFASDFGKSNCAGGCEGDFNSDADVDGSELATFIRKFGRTDCL